MENQQLFLLNDDTAAHRPVLVKDFLTENTVTALEHPLYCPDLAAAAFYLFPRLKSALKGRRFCGGTDIKMRQKGSFDSFIHSFIP
jgi:transposase